jgi:hypothetical protein
MPTALSAWMSAMFINFRVFQFRSLALYLMILAGLGGCAKQSDPYDKIPQVELKGAGCIQRAPTAIENFLNGSGNATEISGMWNCLHYALGTFSTYVRGSDKTRYTGEELREFLEDYFLQNAKPMPGEKHVISDQLLTEAMKLKRVFLGGSEKSVTKDEIVQTFDLLASFNSMSLELVPHTKVLFGGSKSKGAIPAAQAADQGLVSFESVARQMGRLLNNEHSRYQFSDLSSLLHEVYLYFHNANPNSTLPDYSIYVPLLAQIKGALMNSDRSRIESGDWLALGPFVARGYSVFLRASYYMSGNSLLAVDPLSEVRALMLDLAEVFRQAIANRKGAPIPLSDIDNVISEAAALKLLPADIDEDMAKNFVGRMVDFVLNPQNQYPQSGLSNEKLNYVESQIDDWAGVQKALVLNSPMPHQPAWDEMSDVINGPWPLRLDQYGRITLDGDTKAATNIDSNSRLNWARALFHLVFNAYVPDIQRREIHREISTAELHTAYLDLKPLLMVFGLVSKGDTAFDKKIFRDANLFMPRSDGDHYLSFNELIEYVHFVFSGIDAGHVLVDNMQASCNLTPTTVDVNCFRRDFRQKSDLVLSHMPIHQDFAKKMSDKSWQRYIRNLEIINRTEGDAPTPISRSSIYESFVLLQYIEVLMLRFDADRDGQLSLGEALNLLGLFKNTIASALGLDPIKDKAEIEVIFTYLLHYGELPNAQDPLSAVRYENWKLKRDHWELGIDRGAILQIISALSKLGL